jgi:hypothetical protein
MAPSAMKAPARTASTKVRIVSRPALATPRSEARAAIAGGSGASTAPGGAGAACGTAPSTGACMALVAIWRTVDPSGPLGFRAQYRLSCGKAAVAQDPGGPPSSTAKSCPRERWGRRSLSRAPSNAPTAHATAIAAAIATSRSASATGERRGPPARRTRLSPARCRLPGGAGSPSSAPASGRPGTAAHAEEARQQPGPQQDGHECDQQNRVADRLAGERSRGPLRPARPGRRGRPAASRLAPEMPALGNASGPAGMTDGPGLARRGTARR